MAAIQAKTLIETQQRTPEEAAQIRLETIIASTRGTTVFERILKEQMKYKHATGEFTLLITELIVCCKIIASKMQRAGIADIHGLTGEMNVQGEQVKLMDQVSNDVIMRRLLSSGHVCLLITEEEEEPVFPPEHLHNGGYVVALDPLDGSSNIDCNVPVGTIFSIFPRKSPRGTRATMEDALRPVSEMVCAGYVTYGPAVMMVISWGQGVHGFTFDPQIGEFVMTHPNMRIPPQRSIYSVNDGNYFSWSPEVRAYIDYIKQVDKQTSRPYSSRYVGSMVADVHRTLLYGGVFMYPAMKGAPQGKLRLLYEVAPMSYLMEQAGGKGVTGTGRVLDLVATSPHMRVPAFLGSSKEIELLQEFLDGKRTAAPASA